ncbi:MAG: cyclase family protein [Anaerolineae bacterium]
MLDAGKLVSLSFAMSPESPVPPAIRPMEIVPRMRLSAGDDANVSRVSFDNHSNTHVDAPAHVVAGGLSISAFTWQDLTFSRPVVVDLPLPDCAVIGPEHLEPHREALRGADMLLLRLGYGPVRRSEPRRYLAKCPGFGVPGATFLRDAFPNLHCVGMDVPSFSCIEYLEETMRAHNVLLEGEGRKYLLVEDMDLDKDLTRLQGVLVVPWTMAGIDSAPCTVLGILG